MKPWGELTEEAEVHILDRLARVSSQLIAQQVEELLAWGFASALSVVLLAVTFIVIAIYTRFVGLDRLWG